MPDVINMSTFLHDCGKIRVVAAHSVVNHVTIIIIVLLGESFDPRLCCGLNSLLRCVYN